MQKNGRFLKKKIQMQKNCRFLKKKILMQQNGRFLKKKIKILLNNLVVFGLVKLYFSSNHKTGGSLYGKTSTQ